MSIKPAYTVKYIGDWLVHVWPDTNSEPGFYAIHVPASDSDKMYTVILEKDGSLRCECPGWIYHHSCRHALEVTQEIYRRRDNR